MTAPVPGLLEQLIVINRGVGRTWDACMPDQDPLDALDATWEDHNGRLPHEPGYGCAPVPELIPAWVLADARDMHDAGVTLRKIATAVLPVTGCPDVPSCEEILAARLAGGAARTVA